MNRTPGRWKDIRIKNSSWGFDEAKIISDQTDSDGSYYEIISGICPVDAAYIVRAVNCHERLVEALEEQIRRSEHAMNMCKGIAGELHFAQEVERYKDLLTEAEGGEDEK